jgi:hypothetical protein
MPADTYFRRKSMRTGRHTLYLADKKTGLFRSDAGRDAQLDVPLVGKVQESPDVRWLWPERVP